MTRIVEIPSDDEVVAALTELGGHTDALTLCEALVRKGHPEGKAQLAIQRAAERGRLDVDQDWTLRVPLEAVAA